jgi:hypothetical protein
VPLEGVVHALRNVHEALVPGGILLDLHPVPPAEQAEAGGRVLGRLVEDEFFATVAAVESVLEEAVADGLFEPEVESETEVLERFDGVDEFFEIVGERAGATIPRRLARRIRAAVPPVWLRERVVLRRYRASGGF